MFGCPGNVNPQQSFEKQLDMRGLVMSTRWGCLNGGHFMEKWCWVWNDEVVVLVSGINSLLFDFHLIA